MVNMSNPTPKTTGEFDRVREVWKITPTAFEKPPFFGRGNGSNPNQRKRKEKKEFSDRELFLFLKAIADGLEERELICNGDMEAIHWSELDVVDQEKLKILEKSLQQAFRP